MCRIACWNRILDLGETWLLNIGNLFDMPRAQVVNINQRE